MKRVARQVLAVVTALVVLVVSIACVGGTCLMAAPTAHAATDQPTAGHACCGSASQESVPADDGSARCEGVVKGIDSGGAGTASHLLALHWLADLPVSLTAALQPPFARVLPAPAPPAASPPPTLLALGCALNT